MKMKQALLIPLLLGKLALSGCSDGLVQKVEAWADMNGDGTLDPIVAQMLDYGNGYTGDYLRWADGNLVETTEDGNVYFPNGTRYGDIGEVNFPVTASDVRNINVVETEEGYRVFATWPIGDGLYSEGNSIEYRKK